ncbi:MAG: AI-2E family transporter [Microcystis sp. 53602_E8]|nr:AI-2E family transporter [Microcystis sp. 53602_E8]
MTFGSSLGLVLLVFCLLILWQIRQILLLLLMAILLAQILNLAVTWWQRHHLKRSYALIITLFGFFIGIIGIFVGIIPALVQQFRQLFSLLPQAIERLWGQVHSLEDYLDPSLASVLPDFKTLLAQLQPLINQIAGRGLSIFYGTFGIILSLLLIVALGLMILADPAAYYRCFLRLFPAFYRSRVRSILEQCDRDLKAWLKGIFCHMLIMTLGSCLGLSLIGTILPFSIALLEAPWQPWAVLLLYSSIYLLIQYFDRHSPLPILTVRSLKLLPAFTLLAQLFFASIFGFLGLFLAVPLTLIGRIWLKEALIEDILNHWRTGNKKS